jgi:hypothetical protein
VAVHEAIRKAAGDVFRCALSESDADRWLEVPAWMFERMACPDQRHLGNFAVCQHACAGGDVSSDRSIIEESVGDVGCFAFSHAGIFS